MHQLPTLGGVTLLAVTLGGSSVALSADVAGWLFLASCHIRYDASP